MKKFLLIFSTLAISSLSGGNVMYSIQLGTFNNQESAINGKNSLAINIKEDLFVYKTDRGLWTVRCGVGNTKSEVESIRKKSTSQQVRNGRIVPTDENKLEEYNKNYQSVNNNYNNLDSEKINNNKIKNNQNSKTSSAQQQTITTTNNSSSSISDLLSQTEVKTNKNNNQKIDNLEKIEKPKTSVSSANDKKDYFQKKIFELRESYRQIDSYTFRLKVGARVYVIQFTDNPNDELANRLLNQKPTNANLNTVSLSNGIIDILVQLSDIEQSQNDIEKGVIAVLNESRKNPKIRIKAYRIK